MFVESVLIPHGRQQNHGGEKIGKALWELGKHALRYEVVDPNGYLELVANKLFPQDETQKPTGGMLGLNHINIKDASTVLEMLGKKFTLLKRTIKRPLEFAVGVAAKKNG